MDNALNPRMTKYAVAKITEVVCGQTYKSAGIGPEQVFMTSHNPTGMDAFDLFDETQRIFVVKRSEQGYTDVTRITPSKAQTREEWIKLSAGRSLSELWISGEIP